MIRPLPGLRLALLALALALGACDSQTPQRSFEAEAAQPPSGITRTDAEGNVVGAPDPDDWRTSPAFPSVSVRPAYPNPVPTTYTGSVRIPVNIPFTGTVTGGLLLYAYDPRPPGRVRVLDDVPPGAVFEFTELSFTLAGLRAAFGLPDARGLYRLQIRDGSNRLISYGDFRVEG